MKIVSLDAIPVSVPYRVRETSAIIDRGGVSDVIVKLVTDTGLVGWGEACKATDTLALERGVRACAPLLLGRDPWEHEAILADIYKRGLWYLQPMFGNSILAGIDMALWDICGKDCGQPLYKMLGGARRPSVNYAHYVRWDPNPSTIADHAREGVERGYSVFYTKAGVDEAVEEKTLETVRGVIGPSRKIRIDCNQAWSVPTAIRLINALARGVRSRLRRGAGSARADRQHDRCAPRRDGAAGGQRGSVARERCRAHDPRALRRLSVLQPAPGGLDPALRRPGASGRSGGHAALQAQSRRARHQRLGRASGDAGGTERLRRAAAERGAARAATWSRRASRSATGPSGAPIDAPGIGVEVDEDKVRAYHENFLGNVDFTPFGDQRR